MSTYISITGLPTPDDAQYFGVAFDAFGEDVRITLNNESCFPTPDQAREIAYALRLAADEVERRRPDSPRICDCVGGPHGGFTCDRCRGV